MATVSYRSVSRMLRHRLVAVAVFVVLSTSLMAPAAFAQLGVAGVFGSDTNLGVQVSYYRPLEVADIEDLQVGGDFSLYLPETRTFSSSYELTYTYFEFNANAQYTLKSEENRRFYGLGGLNYSYVSVSASDEDGTFGTAYVSGGDAGLNVGGGAELTNSMGRLFGEAKFTLGGFSQLGILVGMRFGGQ